MLSSLQKALLSLVFPVYSLIMTPIDSAASVFTLKPPRIGLKGVKKRALCVFGLLLISSGPVLMIDTWVQQELLHIWVILVVVKHHLFQMVATKPAHYVFGPALIHVVALPPIHVFRLAPLHGLPPIPRCVSCYLNGLAWNKSATKRKRQDQEGLVCTCQQSGAENVGMAIATGQWQD